MKIHEIKRTDQSQKKREERLFVELNFVCTKAVHCKFCNGYDFHIKVNLVQYLQ